jgi:hypothetical protein
VNTTPKTPATLASGSQPESGSAKSSAPTSVHAKALAINLDSSIYGTFAEIGAGQEVARWFLRVGGAAGTIAQTISAYDKTYSDATYGAGTRYVSRERLVAMLTHEFDQLRQRLGATRGAESRFFALADTVSARNYKGDNEQHGWMGLRFQGEPLGLASEILLHVNLMDATAQAQQTALGVLGVNLVDAAFHRRGSADDFLAGLFDELSIERLELDVIALSGPAFAQAEANAWCLRALGRGMAHALVFDAKGSVVEPSSLLRKRPLIVQRGRFETVQPFQAEMLRASAKQLEIEGHSGENAASPVLELSLHTIDDAQPPPDSEVLARVERLRELGVVIVSDFPQNHLLVHYLQRYTQEPIRTVLGVASLLQLLHARYYDTLPGNLLEGLGRFLATNVKVHAYPMPLDAFRRAVAPIAGEVLESFPAGPLVTASDLRPKPPLGHLYDYLCSAGWIVPVSPAS